MVKNQNILLLAFLLLLASSLLTDTNAVKYIVNNNAIDLPGGKRFDMELGVPWTLGLMDNLNQFIWKVFKQPNDATRKLVPILNLYIKTLPDSMGETGGDNIYLSESSITSFAPQLSDLQFAFASLLVHDMTHIFQWSGRGTAPGGLTEGVADYVMIKSGFYYPNDYTKPGEGGRWDEGYGVTARFLEYCDSLRPDFTVTLNNKMRNVYRDSYFLDLLGKPLPQVWAEYKAEYGNIPANSRDALGL